MAETDLSFEEAIEKLELVVNKLERGELSLSESLEEFETGVKLTKFCSTKLEQAEERIEIIKEETDGVKVETYDELEGGKVNEG
ncbi:hypothetical protein JCM16358_08890 [Halanaerocella petrolearia]